MMDGIWSETIMIGYRSLETSTIGRELLDFAIESRKRVKQQLIKMDETFEEVDFSYKVKGSGKKYTIETLEVLEYSHPDNDAIEAVEASDEEEKATSPITLQGGVSAREGQIIIRDNQTGISFEHLFGPYLEGAEDIKVIDPYIRLPYQLRNFMEFAQLITKKKRVEDEVRLHLVTNNNEDYVENAKEGLKQMAESLEPLGVFFTFEFDENIHDRSITLDNGWKIILGRGLDIFQKTGGWFDIAEYDQELRQCKACEVTYVFGV